MKLRDYLNLMDEHDELTVFDNTYDTEFYFSPMPFSNSSWEKSMQELTKLLTITKIYEHGVAVNYTEIVEKKLKELEEADLFIHCDIDSIMCDMNNIMAGYVSEDWMEEFVNILKR